MLSHKKRDRSTAHIIPDEYEVEIRRELRRDVIDGMVRYIAGLPCISSVRFSGRSLRFVFKQYHGNSEKADTLQKIEQYLADLEANARHIVVR